MVVISEEFELKFSELSQAELKGFRAESSQAGAFNFWAGTELTKILGSTWAKLSACQLGSDSSLDSSYHIKTIF